MAATRLIAFGNKKTYLIFAQQLGHSRRFIADLLMSSAAGRFFVEAAKMSLMALVLYIALCSVGEIIVFGIRLIKLVLGDGD